MAGTLVMPEVDRDLCILCGDCVTSCPQQALMAQPGDVPRVNEELCAYCGDCEDICPVGAIRLPYKIVIAEKKEVG